MLRKLLVACWNIALLLISFSQCSQCKTKPIEDITRWELVWDKAAALHSPLPVYDEKSIVCHVPSENAVYVLSPTGDCWKFSQTSAGEPIAQSITGFSQISPQESFFAFSAGSRKEQWLHVGIVDTLGKITLKRYKEGAWEEVLSYQLAGGPFSSVESVACSIDEKNQYNGLILLKQKIRTYSHLSNSPLLFSYDALNKVCNLRKSTVLNSTRLSDESVKTAMEIAPCGILTGSRDNNNPNSTIQELFYWDIQDDVGNPIPLSGGPFKRVSLFLLEKHHMRKAFGGGFVEKNGKTEIQFFTVAYDHKSTLKSSNLPEELKEDDDGKGLDNRIDHSESLILPFSEVVYVVTKDKDGQPVYYKGSLLGRL